MAPLITGRSFHFDSDFTTVSSFGFDNIRLVHETNSQYHSGKATFYSFPNLTLIPILKAVFLVSNWICGFLQMKTAADVCVLYDIENQQKKP